MTTIKPTTIDAYIAMFPENIQDLLQQVRATIKEVAPNAEETISYAIPTFTLNTRYLIHFAGFKRHISIYPVPREHDDFKEELSQYKGGKGTAQFPLEKPLPFDLIKRIVKFRMEENSRNK